MWEATGLFHKPSKIHFLFKTNSKGFFLKHTDSHIKLLNDVEKCICIRVNISIFNTDRREQNITLHEVDKILKYFKISRVISNIVQIRFFENIFQNYTNYFWVYIVRQSLYIRK